MGSDSLYFIPKDIKIKKEIFKGFGMIEIIVMAISIAVGYLASYFIKVFYIKIFIFSFFPFATFVLLMPLPNNRTVFLILKKFFRYLTSQKVYKRGIINGR